jgi:protein TonB
MFDFVLRREVLPRPRYGPALGIAAVFYAGAVAFTVWAEGQVRIVDRQEVFVKFVPPPRAPPALAPAPAPVARPVVGRAPPAARPALPEGPRTVLVQAIVAPTIVPQEKPPEAEPVAAATASDAADADAAYEVPAVPGGIGSDPVVDAAVVELVHSTPALASGAAGRMVPPKFLSGPTPQYTEKAIEREVEGVMEVRCIVDTDGRVRDCQVLKSLPFMDRAVIQALEQRRYVPATLGGDRVDVYYRFRLPFRLAEAVGES